MRLRTPARDRAPSSSGSASTADSSPTGGLVRHLLTAVGIIAFAYAASRLLDSRKSIPAVDEIRERAAETVPDEVRSRAVDAVPDDRIETIRNRTGQTVPDDITEISIDGPRSEASEAEPDLESSTDTIESGDESDVTGLNEDDTDELDEGGTDEDDDDAVGAESDSDQDAGLEE